MKIASIEKLISVEPHPNADRLDLVKVLGYQCVTERGLHKAGDLIVYIQPDSVLPVDAEWAESYRKYSPTRIKAVKLRGEWSEGIIVKFSQLANVTAFAARLSDWAEGEDVAEAIVATHYEPPLPQDLSAKGLLPLGIPKTDEERWENIVGRLPFGEPVDVTLKVDGQSWSAYYDVETKTFGVLGRTMEYKEEAHNRYTAQIARYDIKNKLIAYCEKYGVSLCIRGESYGEGLQGHSFNPHAKEKAGLAIFSVYNIRARKYERRDDEFYFIKVAEELDLPTVPILERGVILVRELIEKYSIGLKKIDGKPFEGVVINHGAYQIENEEKTLLCPDGITREIGGVKQYSAGSFKVINKNYDMNK
jgi:RNA ligase (TIGR02306 family)